MSYWLVMPLETASCIRLITEIANPEPVFGGFVMIILVLRHFLDEGVPSCPINTENGNPGQPDSQTH
jgi:hypothetical protein